MLAILSVLAAPLAPVWGQVREAGERGAQARLPQGRSPIWATLRTTKIAEDDARGLFTAAHPPAVRALVGRAVTLPPRAITGAIVLVYQDEEVDCVAKAWRLLAYDARDADGKTVTRADSDRRAALLPAVPGTIGGEVVGTVCAS